jgi:hypothetical protein
MHEIINKWVGSVKAEPDEFDRAYDVYKHYTFENRGFPKVVDYCALPPLQERPFPQLPAVTFTIVEAASSVSRGFWCYVAQ